MNFLNQIIDRFFSPYKPLPPGFYHYQAESDSPIPYRLHLRIENDGEGVLVVNAKTVLHLNQTATEHLFHFVTRTPENDAIAQISRRYRVKPIEVEKDFIQIKDRILELINTPDLDPETYLGFDRTIPYSKSLSAPLRLDCALTYQTGDDVIDEGDTLSKRVRRELLTEEWKNILDKSWSAGIPHIIFTGGEPTLRPDLPELIAYCEKLGQVTGLLTNGLRISETKYFHDLLQSGLDHIMLVLDSNKEQAWEAIRDILSEDIHLTVHLTITKNELSETLAIFNRLDEMGVKSISLSVSKPELSEILHSVQIHLADRHVSLVWDIPVPYSHMHPIALDGTEEEQVSGAGKVWLYVEPDGDVLPGQGINKVLGNLVQDNWEKIWSNR